MMDAKRSLLVLCLCLVVWQTTEGQTTPSCTGSLFNYNQVEGDNTDVDLANFSTICSDGAEVLSYTIQTGNTNGQFSLNDTTGVLTIQGSTLEPDAESLTSGEYTAPFVMRIKVEDNEVPPLATFLTVGVGIQSINDVTPTFSAIGSFLVLPTTESPPEDEALGSVLYRCSATDTDNDNYPDQSDVVYTIVGSPTNFVLDSQTCKLYLLQAFDFDSTPSYTVDIKASNEDTVNPLSNTQTLTINVGNKNDNSPKCTKYVLWSQVNDGEVNGTSVGTPSCTDADGDTITYTLTGGDTDAFTINSTTGEVTLNRDVDSEAGDTKLSVIVKATDDGSPSQLTATLTVGIYVLDLDDNVPVMDGANVTASIREDSLIGTSVTTVGASDADVTAENSRITFVLQSACTPEDWFIVNPQSGTLITKSLVNSTVASWVTCDVDAYSSTLVGSVSTTTVNITITEKNINPPVFTQSLYEAAAPISEDTNPGSGTVLITVAATDADGSTVTYSMADETTFKVDSANGQVTQVGLLDYETTQSYLLAVEAVDAGDPVLTATSSIYIAISGVNDDPPALDAISDLSWPENSAPGSTILTVNANDTDLGVDGEVEYVLQDTNVPFVLEKTTGKLVVGTDFDRESQAQYSVTVEAYDLASLEANRKTAAVTFTLTLSDVNDNSPTCDLLVTPTGDTGVISITPDDSTTDVIATLTCSDVDSSGPTPTYTKSSGDPSNYFSVDGASGEIRRRDSDAVPGVHSFQITAVDAGGNAALNTIVPIKLYVETSVTFENLGAALVISEDTAVGTSLTTISAKGAYDTLTFTIQTDNSDGSFYLHQTNGVLRLLKPLDRETNSTYTLGLRATTVHGNTADANLDITVTDANDVTPTYSSTFFAYSLAENASPLTIATITATDDDLGDNSVLEYSIASGNSDSKFEYDSSGNLKLVGGLDFETTQAYTLVLQAKDKGAVALTGTSVVLINVTNINDVTTTIVQVGGKVQKSVSEDTTIGAALFSINTTGTDLGDTLTFSITNGNSDSKFSIAAGTGEVYLISALDRESTDFYSLGIKVENNAGESDTTDLEITVTDVNDNTPTFSPVSYSFTVADATAAGEVVGEVTATDLDLAPNGVFTLVITAGNTAGRFTMDTFKVKTTAELLNSDASQYVLTLVATDQGSTPRSSTASVTVTVSPPYTQPTFNPTEDTDTEQETLAIGSILYDCDATAAGSTDGAVNGDLVYTILSGDTNNQFYIEPYTGQIQLLSALDYDVLSSYTLIIRAANRNKLTLTATLTLKLNITQINRESPEFDNSLYNFTISETDPQGSLIGKIAATDGDSGAFGNVSYSIETNSAIAVDSTSGELTTTTDLDFSTDKSFYLAVFAQDDAGVNSFTTTSMVLISVIDVNNNSPNFTNAPFTVYVAETTTASTNIRTFIAEDLDSGVNGDVTYTITSGNTDDAFALNSNTGMLSVNGALDFETLKNYTLTVEAADGGNPSLTGTATITVSITDRNDITPTFTSSRIEAQVFSSDPPLTLVTTVSASDNDTGDAGTLSYLIQSGNTDAYFSIDPTTGEIDTARTLPNAGGYFEMVVIAADRGAPPLTGTTTVAIGVQEVTSPANADHTFSVSEAANIGTNVGSISTNPAHTITSYSFILGNYKGSFAINLEADGKFNVTTAAELDRESYSTYQLTLEVTHTTGQYTESVLITVDDANDNNPVFSTDFISIKMPENTPIGTELVKLTITDADEGVNADLLVTVKGVYAQKFFEVDQATLTIRPIRLIDYEAYLQKLSFQVIARDQGNVQRTGSTTVSVSIVDVAETVNSLSITPAAFMNTVVPVDLSLGSEVYTLTPEAFGLTSGAGDTVEFTMSAQTDNLFLLDSSTGIVTTNQTLNSEPFSRYFQWFTCTVTYANNDPVASAFGLLRIDTFARDLMVSLVSSLSEAELEAQKATLQSRISAKFTSPQDAWISDITQTANTTTTTTRRRLLATDSVAHVVGIADNSVTSIQNIDKPITYLTQEATLAALQQDPDGTAASGLSDGTIPISSVSPYDDGDDGDDDSVDEPLILAAIIIGCIFIAVLVGAIIVLTVYCCRTERLEKYQRIEEPKSAKPYEEDPTPPTIIEEEPKPVVHQSNIFDVDDPDVDGTPSSLSKAV